MNNQDNNTRTNFKKLFNMNNILSQLINFAAYIVLIVSIAVLLYLSFVETFHIKINWLTLGIFSIASVALAWINWTVFYKKQYEKLMSDDIAQHSNGKYSIHARYYYAIKDYSDIELQKSIDKFNNEYTEKWLRWVEKTTGFPIESRDEIELDANGNPVLDSNGQPKTTRVTGIKDLPYKGFKYKMLMWRIKTHHYPQSGYKTSMELMSLFAFQDANLNKRRLKADKIFYMSRSAQRFLSLLMTITVGASVIPEMINGNVGGAILKLLLSLVAIISSVAFGAMNGIQGARLKLSTVEEVCSDLERWSNKKPILAPYKDFEDITKENQITNTTKSDNLSDLVTEEIFNIKTQIK